MPFERDGGFFHKRAVIKADKQSYLDAVGLLRRALELEPNNSEYMLDLADVFARMSCYDESNQVLVSIVRLGEATAECFFGMGCNYYAMDQYERALEALETYRHIDPDGEFIEVAEDLLDELEKIVEEEEPHTSVVARRGCEALDAGDFPLAVQLLTRAVQKSPDSLHLRNNLSLAIYCAGDTDGAAREAAAVLSADPDNLHANCNMAVFLTSRDHKGQAMVHLRRALDAPADGLVDLTKLCLTLCEMRRDEDAYEYLRRLLQARPYDKNALHYFAVACFNLGKYREAVTAWTTARRIDPYNPVPSYCIGVATRAEEDGGDAERMEYQNQLPHKEIQRCVTEFTDSLAGKTKEDFKAHFDRDESFRELLRWGLGVSDNSFRYTVLKLLTYMGGPRAEEMLRDFLMRPDEGEEIKREVMSGLHEMGAEEPYLAILGGSVVEARISVFSSEKALNDSQRAVVQLAVEGFPFAEEMEHEERNQAIRGVIGVWTRYLEGENARGKHIRRPQNWAAALLAVYLEQKGIPWSESRICSRFDIQKRTLRTYMRYLMDE